MEDSVDSLVTRLKVLWNPAGLRDFTAKLNFMRDDREDPYRFSYTRYDVENYYDNRVATSDHENVTDITTDIVSLDLSYELSEHWSLASVTSQSDSDSLRLYDIDLTEKTNATAR